MEELRWRWQAGFVSDEELEAELRRLAAPPAPRPDLPFARVVSAVRAFCDAYLNYGA